MVRLALGLRQFFACSTAEVEREGPSYTVDTLRQLHAAEPHADLYLLLGLDALLELHRWRSPDVILEIARVAAAPRPSYGDPAALVKTQVIPKLPTLEGRLHLLTGPQIEISASDIRRRVREQRSIKYLVPEAVEGYIRWKGLYK
jgi:nicotinate-nucleotide adenylyltransferase